MKTVAEAYQEYKVSEELREKVKNPYDLILNMDEVFKRLEDEERTALRYRRRARLAQRVKFGSLDLLKQEEATYTQLASLVEENLDLLTPMVELVDEESFPEILKMLDFMVEQYVNNREYYNAQIRTINQARKGISYVDYRQENNRKAVKQFFEEKINGMKEQKHLEKKEEI